MIRFVTDHVHPPSIVSDTGICGVLSKYLWVAEWGGGWMAYGWWMDGWVNGWMDGWVGGR